MAANISEFGHDFSGLEASLLTSSNLLAGDPGLSYYATDTKRTWICDGAGVWGTVSGGSGVAGVAGGQVLLNKILTGMTDNTATNLCVVTVPNAIHGAILQIEAVGTLGDGDSSEASISTLGFSRIAGANAKIAISTKSVTAQTTGATGNCAVTISNAAVSGAVGAVNTFQIKATVAHSAGTSSNHVLSVSMFLLNNFASGITVA